ncbi:MAG: hypothetical protein LBV34_06815 [Nocardiopsaceae bacterium]|nr:hypothetical protein [Nocardiopsaceae bacterium]
MPAGDQGTLTDRAPARRFVIAALALGVGMANLLLFVTGNGRGFLLGTVVWLALGAVLSKPAFGRHRREN